MNDSSTMISQSIIDKVDMSQFYGRGQGALTFSCIITLDDGQVFAKLLSFKRNLNTTTLTLTCNQSETIPFIAGADIIGVCVVANEVAVYDVLEDTLNSVEIDIKFLVEHLLYS